MSSINMRTTLFETENTIIEIENDTLIGTFKKENVNLTIAKNVVKDRLKGTEGKSYPILIDIRNIKSTTKTARQFLASEKGCEGITSAAIFINSSIGSMMGNFFIFFNRPLVPTKLFSNKKEAMEWLMQFVNKK